MNEYRFTFGVQYAQDPHPNCSWVHPDGWLTVLAPDRTTARAMAAGVIGHVDGENSPIAYAFEYEESEWPLAGKRRGLSWDDIYPGGELARITFEIRGK